MAAFSQYEGILHGLLTTCDFATSDFSLKQLKSESKSFRFRLRTKSSESDQEQQCELVFKRRKCQEYAEPYQCLLISHHHQVIIHVICNHERLVEQSTTPCPLILYDVCKFASKCLNVPGIEELSIQLDIVTAKLFFASDFTGQSSAKVRNILSSTFVFCHHVRVPGDNTTMEAVWDSGNESLRIVDDEEKLRPLLTLSCTNLNGEDATFIQEFKRPIQLSLEDDGSSTVVCILFDEMETSNWYLNRGVSSQRQRLPNHDITRVQLKSDGDGLRIQVTAFDFKQKNCYYDAEFEKEVNAFQDDKFFGPLTALSKEYDDRKFHVECYIIPCGTTRHLMQVSTGETEIDWNLQTVPDKEELESQSNDSDNEDDASYDSEEDTDPFLTAIEDGNEAEFRTLLENIKSDVDALTNAFKSVLSCESFEMAELLLNLKPELITDERAFSTAYLIARKSDHTDICGLLLKKRYKLSEADINKAARLTSIVCRGDAKILSTELSKSNCNHRDWDCMTPIMPAAIGCWKPHLGHADCAELLLRKGAHHSAIDLHGNTPLHLAAASGNLPVFRLLLAAGASTDKINFDDATPLMMAEQEYRQALSDLVEATESYVNFDTFVT